MVKAQLHGSSRDVLPGHHLVAIAAAAVCSFAVIVTVGIALLDVGRPRHVRIDGAAPTYCHGTLAWTGELAFTVCAQQEGSILLEFRPETAEATVRHRWPNSRDSELSLARSCPDGVALLVEGADEATIVTIRDVDTQVASVPEGPRTILGMECDRDGVEAFARTAAQGYVVGRVSEGRLEPMRAVSVDSAPGPIAAAWYEDGTWHAVARVCPDRGSGCIFPGRAVVGPQGGTFEAVRGLDDPLDFCLTGAPGGWSCLDGSRPGSGSRGGIARRLEAPRWTSAISSPFGARRILTLSGLPAAGLADVAGGGESEALGIHWSTRDDQVFARHPEGDAVPIANARWSALLNGAVALGLSDGRTAVWGSSSIVIVDAQLRRVDGPGVFARLVSPLGDAGRHLELSRRVTYAALSFSTVAWLAMLFASRTRRGHGLQRFLHAAAAAYLLLFVVCAVRFWRLVWFI